MLFNMYLTQFLAAGVMGWPLVLLGIAIAEFLFDDEDDPDDYKGRLQQWADDKWGKQGGEAFLKGIPNALGVDMHSRLTLSDLWWRTSDRELQGSAQREELLKAIGGPMMSILVDVHRGYEQMSKAEDIWEQVRAIETMSPKLIKDAAKAVRYAREGLKGFSGSEIMPAEDMSNAKIIMRAFGFSPAEVSKLYDAKGAVERISTRRKWRKKHITQRLTVLYERKVAAIQERREEKGLDGKIKGALFMAESWNLKNPGNEIDISELGATLERRWLEGQKSKLVVRNTKGTQDLLREFTFGDP